MSVLINMEMPEHCGYCRFRYDGICHALQKTQYSMEECPLVPVPPHGRSIDADALITTFCEWGTRLERGRKLVITMSEAKQAIVDIIDSAPAIIPPSGGKENE